MMKSIRESLIFTTALIAVSALLSSSGAWALLGDVDGSGRVDGMDLIQVAASFGTVNGDKSFILEADINATGEVDGYDLALLANSFGRTREQDARIEFLPGEVLVKFSTGTPQARINEILAQEETSVIRHYPRSGIHRLAVESGLVEEVAAARFLVHNEVEYSERNLKIRKHYRPNDPRFDEQWNFAQLQLEQVWDMTGGGSQGVIVAVLDSGVAYENFQQFGRAPDLSGTTFVSPFDVVDNDTHANDLDGHGTHVSGTIAQTTNNGYGVAGMAYNCAIMPIRVLGADGTGAMSDLAEGLYWAADHGANVTNMSLGSTGTSSAVRTALRTIWNRGVVNFASAGNAANDPGWDPVQDGVEFPAREEHCIAVGASRYDRNRSDYSNYGADAEILAPGGDVSRDQDNNGYPDGILQETYSNSYSNFRFAYWDGTSMSCPHAAALGALIASAGLTDPDAMRQLLYQTADDLGPSGWDQEHGFGLINPVRALIEVSGRGSGWID